MTSANKTSTRAYTTGCPYDRGRADSWYMRPFTPHHRRDGTEVPLTSKKDIAEYTQGFEDNESEGGHKDWW